MAIKPSEASIAFNRREHFHMLAALDLLKASLTRAEKAEKEADIREVRQRQIAEVATLINRVHSLDIQ